MDVCGDKLEGTQEKGAGLEDRQLQERFAAFAEEGGGVHCVAGLP